MEILGDIAGVEVWDGCWACVRMLVWCEGACKLVVTVTTCTLSHTHTHTYTPPRTTAERCGISDNLR